MPFSAYKAHKIAFSGCVHPCFPWAAGCWGNVCGDVTQGSYQCPTNSPDPVHTETTDTASTSRGVTIRYPHDTIRIAILESPIRYVSRYLVKIAK